MRPGNSLTRSDSARDYIPQTLHPVEREAPLSAMGEGLLPVDMLRSDAPPPLASRPSGPALMPPAPPRRPRVVPPINRKLATNVMGAVMTATGITSVVLAFVYGIRIGNRYPSMPGCVTKPGDSWRGTAPQFNPAVADCDAQYDAWRTAKQNAHGGGLLLFGGVVIGGLLAAGVLGSLAGVATESVQNWYRGRQVRAAEAEVAQAPTMPVGIEMV